MVDRIRYVCHPGVSFADNGNGGIVSRGILCDLCETGNEKTDFCLAGGGNGNRIAVELLVLCADAVYDE